MPVSHHSVASPHGVGIFKLYHPSLPQCSDSHRLGSGQTKQETLTPHIAPRLTVTFKRDLIFKVFFGSREKDAYICSCGHSYLCHRLANQDDKSNRENPFIQSRPTVKCTL